MQCNWKPLYCNCILSNLFCGNSPWAQPNEQHQSNFCSSSDTFPFECNWELFQIKCGLSLHGITISTIEIFEFFLGMLYSQIFSMSPVMNVLCNMFTSVYIL